MPFRRFLAAAALAAASLLAPPAAAQQRAGGGSGSATLDAIRSRGALLCGVSGEIAGFSLPDSRSAMQGLDADYCRAIAVGLDDRWADEILRQVGNYGEMWERHITPMGIERGRNALWTQGGLQFAPPMR